MNILSKINKILPFFILVFCCYGFFNQQILVVSQSPGDFKQPTIPVPTTSGETLQPKDDDEEDTTGNVPEGASKGDPLPGSEPSAPITAQDVNTGDAVVRTGGAEVFGTIFMIVIIGMGAYFYNTHIKDKSKFKMAEKKITK
jgi:hypothetical protein